MCGSMADIQSATA